MVYKPTRFVFNPTNEEYFFWEKKKLIDAWMLLFLEVCLSIYLHLKVFLV